MSQPSGQVLQNVLPIAGVGIASGLGALGAGLLATGTGLETFGGPIGILLGAPITALAFWGLIDATKDTLNLIKERDHNIHTGQTAGPISNENFMLAKYAMHNHKQRKTDITSDATILATKN
jgi:hypothetical protein